MKKYYPNFNFLSMQNFNRVSFVLMFALLVAFANQAFAQNMVAGTSFNTAWPNNACNSTSGWPSTYMAGGAGTSQIYTSKSLNGTGNQYWRFGVNYGSNTGSQYNTNGTSGPDVLVTTNTTYTLNTNCTSNGAMYYNVGSTSYNYVFKTASASSAAGGTFTFFEVQGAVQTVSTVTQSPTSANVFPGQAVTVSATMSGGTLPTGQAVYLRYTNNAFSTTTVVQMTGSGPYTATIPASVNTPGAALAYYVFTSGNGGVTAPASGSGVYSDGSNADFFTINLNNNSGSNYSYSVAAGWVTAATGNWSTAATWTANAVPPTTNDMGAVQILHQVAEDQNATTDALTVNIGTATKTLTINSGVTLTTGGAVSIGGSNSVVFGATGTWSAGAATITNAGTINMTSGGNLNLANNAILTNNSAFTRGTGTVTTAGIATINGSAAITFNNLTLTIGAVTLSTIPTIDGTLTINGGHVTAAPYYTSNSTLTYGATYNRYIEWSATAPGTLGTTAGYPNSVTIGAGTLTVYNSGQTGGGAMAGNLNIGTGTTMDFTGNTTPFVVGGSVTTTGTGVLNFSNTTQAITIAGGITNAGTLTMSSNSAATLNIGGSWSNSGTFTPGTAATVDFNGSGAQGITNASGETFYNLQISNSSGTGTGVTMANNVTVTKLLTLTNGVLNTNSKTLTISNTANSGMSAGSQSPNTTYINGAVTWDIATNPGTNYLFPVGVGGNYLPFTLNSPTGTLPIVTVTAVSGAPSGSADGTSLSSGSLSSSEYWTATYTGTYTGGTVSLLQQSSLGASNAIGRSTASNGSGTYSSIGGSVSGNGINGSANTGSTLGSFAFATLGTPAPTVTSVAAGAVLNGQSANNSGYIGQSITITGTNFPSNATVTFNGVSAFAVTWNSATSLTAIVPLTATSGGYVVVTNPTTSGTGSYTTTTFSVLGYISVASTDWNTNTTWLNGGSGATNFTGTSAIPAAGSTVSIVNAVTVTGSVTNAPTVTTIYSGGSLSVGTGGSITSTGVTVNSGGTLTFNGTGSLTATTVTNGGTLSWTAAGTLNIASAGTLTNNGTFTAGSGTVAFSGNNSSIAGTTITFNNLTVNFSTGQGLTMPASPNVPIINGTLTMQGGHLNSAPIYTSSSTLYYAGSFTRYYEWTATTAGTIGTTAGYPNNVTVNTGTLTVYNSGLAGGGAMAGNLVVNTGAVMDFTGSTTTFAVAGNVTTNGTGSITFSNLSAGVNIGGSLTNAGSVSMGSMGSAMTITGSVGNTGTISLSSTSGSDLIFGVNFTNSGTYTDNGRATEFNGSGTGLFTTTALNISYLLLNGTGTLQLANSNLSLTGTASQALQFLNATTLDLEGYTLTMATGTTILLNHAGVNTIQSTPTGGVLALSGTETLLNTSGTLATSANVTITNAGVFTIDGGLTVNGSLISSAQVINSAASGLTVNGIFQFNAGGYISNNAPVYGSSSTLIYNIGSVYGVGTEWTAGATTGAGVPANVQIGNGVASSGLNLGGGTYTMTGNLTFSATATNANAFESSGTLTIGGNWVNNTSNTANYNNSTPAGTVVIKGTSIGGTNTNANGYDFNNLTINNASGVTVGAAISVAGTLTLTAGIVTTSSSNTLTIKNTATTAISGAGSSTYISGPLNWTFAASLSAANTYTFPVGDAVNNGGAYLPFALSSNTTGATAPVIQVQAFNKNSSGTADGSTVASISNSEYWTTSVVSGNYTSGKVSLTKTTIGADNTIAQASTVAGTYSSIGGGVSGNSVTNSNTFSTLGDFVFGILPGPVVTSVTSSNSANNTGYTGSTITINGTNLQVSGASNITFGGTAAAAITTNTSTQLVVTLGAGASGTISITNTAAQTGTYGGFTYLGYITNAAADYNTGSTWLGGGLPPASSTVTINNNGVTISGASNSPSTMIINSGATLNISGASGAISATTITNSGTLTFSAAGSVTATTVTNSGTLSWTAAGTLNIASAGTLTNNGTFTAGSGIVSFSGNSSTLAGSNTVTFNNLTINFTTGQGLTIPASPHVPIVNGTLTMEGGHLNSAPIYTSSSTLYYAGSFNRYYEWTATTTGTIGATAGYPNNVTVNTGTVEVYNSGLAGGGAMAGNLVVNTGAVIDFTGSTTTFAVGGNVTTNGTGSITFSNLSAAVNIAGNLTNAGTLSMGSMGSAMTVTGSVSNSGTISLSSTSGSDLIFGGNLSNTGTYTDNGRATEFNGSSNGTISSTPALSLSYLLLGGTGNLQLGSSTITLAGTSSQALQFLSTGVLDLEGYTLTMATGTSIQLNNNGTVQSSSGTGTLAFAGILTVPNTGTNSLTTSANVLVTVSGDLTINTASGLKVNGTLQINGGGYITSNVPVYGSASTLVYNAVVGYGNNNEWTGGASTTVAAGAGVPANVILQGTGTYSVDLTGARGVPGNIQINSGNTLNLTGDLYLGGNLTVNGPLATALKAVWFVEGNAQSINSTSYPDVTFDYLLIDKTSNAVTLNIPIIVNQILTLSGGNINSTSTNIVNILNTGTGGIASGSTSSYINGPVNWTLPASLSASANVYTFPVGDAIHNGGAYLPLSITTVTTGSTGPVVQVQATNSGSGGSYNNVALEAISSTEYWQVSQVSGNYTSASVSLTRQAALGSLNAIGWNNSSASGTYVYEAGTVSGTSINNSNVVGAGYLVMAEELPAPVVSSVTVGTPLNSQAANTGYIGQTITITGSNFPSSATVTFNGTAALAGSITVTGSTSITAIVNSGTTATTGTVVVTDPSTSLQGSAAFTNLGYISAANGDWNTTGTWLDGATVGIPASAYPVTIVNNVSVGSAVSNPPATVTITSAGELNVGAGTLTATTVNNTGLLTFSGTGSLTVTNITNNSAGTISWTSTGTLAIAAAGTLSNNGTFTAGSGTVNFTGAGTVSGTITFANVTMFGGVNFGSASTIGTALTLDAGGYVSANPPVYATNSTLIYNTGATTYGRYLEWNATSGAGYPYNVTVDAGSSLDVGNGGTATAAQIAGSLDVEGGFYMDFGYGTGTDHDMTAAVTVLGNVTIGTAGILSLSQVSGGDLKLAGNWVRNGSGSYEPYAEGTFFIGGNAQTLTGQTTFAYVNMSKTANNLTLNNNMIVNNTIFFASGATGGLIVTGSNTVEMGSAGANSGATNGSHIEGNESYAVATGSNSYLFDIGDANYVTAVNLTYTGVTTAGTVTAYTTDGTHPQIATSGLYAPHSVNRYYTLTNSGVAGGSYTSTFYYNANDLGSGSVTSDFVVMEMEYASSAWNTTTTGTLTGTSTQATGLTTYSDFQIGDLAPQGSLTGGSTCAGTTGQLTWTSTAGTGPFSVVYNDGVSNHTATGVLSGTAFNVSSGPSSTTTYTLVSVTDANGDVTTSGFTTSSATITVIPTVPVSVSILASPTGSICSGSSVSFVASPTNGGSSPTYNFKVNGTSVQSGTNTVLTSNTINNGDVIICYMTSDAVCPSPTTATSNSITESVNPLPTVYTVTGGGNFCPGGGAAVGLSNSQSTISYQLKNGASSVGSPVIGNGSAITFGSQSTGATYTVVATDPSTDCVNNMSGNAVVVVNPQAATPGLGASATTVCSGSPVTFTATGGSQYGFYVNGTLATDHYISDTSTFTTTSLNNGDQVTVTSFSPFTFDGNIVESAWGSPIATSTGGPYDNGGTLFGGGPGFGVGHEINALYALSDANNINFAIAGNVQNTNRILLFIQSTTGGYSTGNFGRLGASSLGAIYNFNSGTTFDFSPNYILSIGTNSGQTDYFFDLYTLSGTASSGGGPDVYLGDIAVGSDSGAVLGANPANGTQTQGFEVAIPKRLLKYTNGNTVKVMAMYVSDAGYLSNQFLTHASAGAANYGSGAINFTGNPGSFSIPALNLDDLCSATSAPITMSIGSNLTPTLGINASATSICTGTNVTFTSSETNGGTSPSYQWTKNGSNVGTNSSSYSSNTLNNGDQIQCVMTSNASCVSTPTATSNTITMTVNSTLTPLVSIAASPSGAVCSGTNVTFTPTPTFGGTSPTYQWTKNGSNVATGATYSSSTLANGDQIACVMTSNAGCASPTTANSNTLTMSINPLPTVYNVTGGGAYCSGTSGATIGLSGSQNGANYQYQLYSGASTVGSAVTGSGSALSFGPQLTSGTDYTVTATNTTTGCSVAMTGIDSVFTNITPTTPSLFVSQNPICTGTDVTFSAANGSLFQFFVNNVSQGAESTTDFISSSSFNNGDQVKVESYSSIVYDGNIVESIWGSPLATSTGGPSPGFGAGNELNAVYANGDGAHVNLAIAGNVQSGNRILLFIDSKAGGFNVANFNETNAPPGLAKFNTGTTFPTGFSPDYCLVIGVNGSNDNYFDLFTLASTSGAGTDAYLGGRTIHNFGVQAGGNPANSSQTQGFEISLPNSLLGYTGGNIQVMGMYISESTGFLSNQFLTHADPSENNYGSGAVYFPSATPKSVNISAYLLDNTCTATSAPTTMSVSAQPSSGSLTPTPALGTYCAGTSLSAASGTGSGGAGTVADVLQYSTNGGSSWQSYTSASAINSSGLSSVEVQTYRTSSVAGCTTSTPDVITWNLNPLPISHNVTGELCAPASIGLDGSQSGSNYVYALWVTNASGDSTLLNSNAGTGGAISYGDQVDVGIYNVIATNTTTGCVANMNGVATVGICTTTWTGLGSDANWTTQDNWNPAAVPDNCYADVVIPSNTARSPIIAGSDIYVKDISIASGVILTLNGNNLNLCGNWTGGSGSNAAVVGSGTVYLDNTASVAQTISGNTQFNILQINNATGVSMTTGAKVAISTGLQLQAGTFGVPAGDTLHLLSTASNSYSYIDDFTGTGTLTGTILADRYVPVKGFNQHFISSPVSTPSLAQIGASGPDGSYVEPFDCDEYQSNYNSPYGTVFQYNDGHMASGQCMLGNWQIRSQGSMVNGLGYSTYLTGDNTLTLTGTANTGNLSVGNLNNSGYPTVNTTEGQPIESGWNLVGNPYPSAITLTASRMTQGFQNQVQVWVSSGPFQGSWQYAVIDSSPSSALTIPPFQAFMVRVIPGSTGTHSYPFYQGERVRTGNISFYRTQTDNTLELDLTYNGIQDAAMVAFKPNATNGFDDAYDANKPDGGQGRPTLYTTMNDNHWYGLNCLPPLSQVATVPMGLHPEVTGTMTINPKGIESFDPTSYIYLEDKQTNTWQNLRNGGYTFTAGINDPQDRFILHFTPPAEILTRSSDCNTTGLITISQPGTANWSFVITNSNNTIVATGTLNQSNQVIVDANAGVYTVTLTDTAGYTVVKNIQVGGADAVVAEFTSSINTAQIAENITFNGSSESGATYSWNFGDGTTADGQTVTHDYTQPGVYTAELTVTNSSGCISTTTRVITVTSHTATGITNVNDNGKINIWSNENRVYVDFSNEATVDAQVDIYNVLGQLLSSEKFGKANLYSKEIDNLEAAYMIVQVKNNDQITTKKVFLANVNK